MIEDKIMSSYCALMEEIKERHAVVQQCLYNNFLPPKYRYELCYLQFRMICELVALASLLVHKSVSNTVTERITKAYQADVIVRRLELLHPDFYPKPTSTMDHEEVLDLTDGYLTKAELITLNLKCGSVLHRGTFKRLFINDEKPKHANEVAHWLQKITLLLTNHRIVIADSEYEMWVMMKEAKTGKVNASLLKKVACQWPRE